MNALNFTKMHGLGNDFMVVDALTQKFDLSAEQIAALGDRHTGVGFDQLLVIAPPDMPEADFWYRIYNSDGSMAEQCGNGVRCAALFVRRHELASRDRLVWQTVSGQVETHYRGNEIEVDMGPPAFAAESVPYIGQADEEGVIRLTVEEAVYEVHPVSMGNPHGVLFVESVNDAPVQEIGAALTAHPAFPEGANIGFCQVVDRGFIRLRVYERGAGETRACGTGACAAAVAARQKDLVNERVKVSLPGGKLRIHWAGGDATVKMSGPATAVYEGSVQMSSAKKAGRSSRRKRSR